MLARPLLTDAGADEMYQVLRSAASPSLEGIVLVLFVVLFAWVALSFVSALAGFVALLARRRDDLDHRSRRPVAGGRPPHRAAAADLQRRPAAGDGPPAGDLRSRSTQTGSGAQFDLFILSDTTDPAHLGARGKVLPRAAATTQRRRLFYRHRADNTARKAGNIADWVKRFGGAYDIMIILDADSLMTGDTMVRLAAAMERIPTSG